MSGKDRFIKRMLDIVGSAVALFFVWPVILLTILAARFDTGKSGLFYQIRVGRNGRRFRVLKIRTMRDNGEALATSVTTRSDPRITSLGAWLRANKLDELPQLFNVLIGDMSIVGPRPDVPELVDSFTQVDSTILSVRPGLTGPASLKYRNEEDILDLQQDPEAYNRAVIFPDKLEINRRYVAEFSIRRDFHYIWKTLFGCKTTLCRTGACTASAFRRAPRPVVYEPQHPSTQLANPVPKRQTTTC